MNPKVEAYLKEGCGRCDFYQTSNCKVNSWHKEMTALRKILLTCNLKEEIKWSVPCYTYDGSNILLMSAFKDYCSLGFFKGALLKDSEGILSSPGKNSQAVRQIRFYDMKEVSRLAPAIKKYIREAIELEKSGLKVEFKKNPEPIPEELETKFRNDPLLKAAFESLTPGRQRGYILYFSQPKQPKTRTSRIENYRNQILEGRGFHDR